MSDDSGTIPNPVVGRLTKYLVLVQGLREAGQEWVSSSEMADALGLTSSTVRQDLSHIDVSGTAKRGYETKRLEWVLYKELGADRVTNVAIVGAGNVGRALALHGGFERSGFAIRAVFDADARLVGKRLASLEIRHVDEVPAVIAELKIDIGMITVPGEAAQGVADALVAAGVRGLLNFSPVHVDAPETVPVVDIRIIARLQELLYSMKSVGRPTESIEAEK